MTPQGPRAAWGTGGAWLLGKEDTAVGCVSHEPVVTAMLALMVGLGREAPTALSLPGLRACVWAVTQQRREGQCPVLAPAQQHLWPFVQGQQP